MPRLFSERCSASLRKRRLPVVNLFLLLALALEPRFAQAATEVIRPGKVWRDTHGRVIQAHGGGILQHEDRYYWYGEAYGAGGQRSGPRHAVMGISCYSSEDLVHWKPEGLVLPTVKDDPGHDLHPSKVCQRPKVLFNPPTKRFVMWWHVDTHDYELSKAGIAVADKPTGPFRYVRSFRPINEQGFRDMNLFLDDDGRAYVFYASERNLANYVSQLNADFTDVERPAIQGKTWERNFAGTRREAPAPFKHGGQYYLITSDCTGWKPNEADLAVAGQPIGPYKPLGNPCVGPDAERTFLAQSTFVLPAPSKPGTFIFMADRWSPNNLGDSRYIWLPFTVETGKPITIQWRDSWSFSYLP